MRIIPTQIHGVPDYSTRGTLLSAPKEIRSAGKGMIPGQRLSGLRRPYE